MSHLFPTLYRASVLHRPSKIIKSPYVADVLLEDGTHALCHTPGLGCCGMVAPGRTIYVSSAVNPRSKTAYTAQLAECEDEEGVYHVGIHPMVSQAIAATLLDRIHPSATWKTEVKIDDHTRLDFVGTTPEGKTLYVEVKNAMISHQDQTGRATRRAVFPEGFRTSRAASFSPRAVKHAETLAALTVLPDAECYLLYILPRHDCQDGLELNRADPIYCQAVANAMAYGVHVRVFGLHANQEGITFEAERAFHLPS
jgi:DNA-binding sugar fermentation-stimulating protein